MNDLFVWMKDAFNSRFGSIMYGTLIITWLTTNRKFWFVSFFINEQYIRNKYELLKSEYIYSLYSFHDIWSFIWVLLKLVLIPALVTYLVHWQFYKIEKIVYAKWLSNKTEKKILRAKEDEKYQKIIGRVEEEKSKNLNKQKQNFEKEIEIKSKKIKSMEEKWSEEYKEVSRLMMFESSMHELERVLYSKNGRINISDFSDRWKNISEQSLWFLDSNGLININTKEQTISATEKGKFFMKNFINK